MVFVIPICWNINKLWIYPDSASADQCFWMDTDCILWKVHPRTGHEGPEGNQRYRSKLSLTFALQRGRWSMPRPVAYALAITQYLLYKLYMKISIQGVKFTNSHNWWMCSQINCHSNTAVVLNISFTYTVTNFTSRLFIWLWMKGKMVNNILNMLWKKELVIYIAVLSHHLPGENLGIPHINLS